MCNRLCYFAAGLILFFVVVKASGFDPPFHFNAFPPAFMATDGHRPSAPDDVVVDKKFSVSEGDQLRVDVGHSDVFIRTGSGKEASVRIEVDGERARRFFEHLNFSVEQDGRTVSITTNPRGSWNRGGGEITVYVTIPERFDASLDVAHGDVQIDRVDGRHDIRLAHGDLEVSSLTGSSLEMNIAHGDVEAERLMSEKIKIQIAHGDIEVASLMAANFDIEAQHGDVEIRHADGVARVSGSHSDVAIAFEKLNGGEFSSTHGDIDIAAPAGAAADIDFAASEIDISAGHGFVGTLKEERAQGRVSGGGPKLVARTTHGEITLRERD